ncbi:MFS transporter [Streptomyces sp. NBC_01320]|uniref:MFS transporter n=1 Tax=Streptomyces sp. NBC_01320 TaxID=2903824 RepID=UPI002E1232E4|nr:MHS family MFS transporter [Streptomyces sp. NBC_01320]
MASAETGALPHRPSHARIAFATGVGTAIEYYDFLIYAIASSMVFGTQFFPAGDPVVSTLLAFATFGVGFIARPLGGAIAGHFGDRLGRKFMLVVTMVTMAISTFCIGLLPNHAAIGVWAPVLLVLARLVQGFSAGGEWGGGTVTAVEHAPPGKRGLYGSWTILGTSVGPMLGIAAFTLVGRLDEEAFASWGWRLPFLASAALLAVGLYVRLGLTETREFTGMKSGGQVARMPALEVIRTHPGVLLRSVGSVIAFSTMVYVAFTFVLSYGTENLGFSRTTFLNFTMIALAFNLVTVPFFAALSDRVGRKPVMLGGALFLVFFAFAFFPMLDTKNHAVVLLALILANNSQAPIYGPMAAHFSELYEPRVRFSGVSLGVQTGHVLGGGLAPFLATALYAAGGRSVWPVAFYLAVTAVISVLAIAGLPETVPGRRGTADGSDRSERAVEAT